MYFSPRHQPRHILAPDRGVGDRSGLSSTLPSLDNNKANLFDHAPWAKDHNYTIDIDIQSLIQAVSQFASTALVGKLCTRNLCASINRHSEIINSVFDQINVLELSEPEKAIEIIFKLNQEIFLRAGFFIDLGYSISKPVVCTATIESGSEEIVRTKYGSIISAAAKIVTSYEKVNAFSWREFAFYDKQLSSSFVEQLLSQLPKLQVNNDKRGKLLEINPVVELVDEFRRMNPTVDELRDIFNLRRRKYEEIAHSYLNLYLIDAYPDIDYLSIKNRSGHRKILLGKDSAIRQIYDKKLAQGLLLQDDVIEEICAKLLGLAMEINSLTLEGKGNLAVLSLWEFFINADTIAKESLPASYDGNLTWASSVYLRSVLAPVIGRFANFSTAQSINSFDRSQQVLSVLTDLLQRELFEVPKEFFIANQRQYG